jgi:serine/threonine protein phosphatase PrpC
LSGSPVAAAAERLIERALARGARDNVSVVVIGYAP